MIVYPGVLICDKCVRLYDEILKEEFEKDPAMVKQECPCDYFGKSSEILLHFNLFPVKLLPFIAHYFRRCVVYG